MMLRKIAFSVSSQSEVSPVDSRWFGLDALRALAIVMVVVYHLNLAGIFNGGFLGVDLFFVLSGFLITWLLLREVAATTNRSLIHAHQFHTASGTTRASMPESKQLDPNYFQKMFPLAKKCLD